MKIYECDANNYLIRISDVNQSTSEMLLSFSTNTAKAPSSAFIAGWRDKKYNLQFDLKNQKWHKIEFDQEEIFKAIFREIDHEISGQIYDGTFTFSNASFYIDDRSQLKWSEIATKMSLNLIEFPFEIKSAGDNYLTIGSASEFSEFYKKFVEERENIRKIGRLLKYDEEKSVKNVMEPYQWKAIIDNGQLEDKIHELFEAILHPPVEGEVTENDNA